MKKLLLSVVAIATLLSTVQAECNIPDMTKYIPKNVKCFGSQYPEFSGVGALSSRIGAASGSEQALEQLYGKFSTNKLKLIGGGANISTSYKQIYQNYATFVASLNNVELARLQAFLNAYPEDEVVKMEQWKPLGKNKDTYLDIIWFSHKYSVENELPKSITTGDGVSYFDPFIFIVQYVLGIHHEFEGASMMQDPQLKQFVKAIIEGDYEKAKATIVKAKIYFAGEWNNGAFPVNSTEILKKNTGFGNINPDFSASSILMNLQYCK